MILLERYCSHTTGQNNCNTGSEVKIFLAFGIVQIYSISVVECDRKTFVYSQISLIRSFDN